MTVTPQIIPEGSPSYQSIRNSFGDVAGVPHNERPTIESILKARFGPKAVFGKPQPMGLSCQLAAVHEVLANHARWEWLQLEFALSGVPPADLTLTLYADGKYATGLSPPAQADGYDQDIPKEDLERYSKKLLGDLQDALK